MRTCLVVDDSGVTRKIARRILEELGFNIIEAEDGESLSVALSNADEVERPDVIERTASQTHVGGGETELGDVREVLPREVRVGDHDALRTARGSRGVHQHRDLFCRIGFDRFDGCGFVEWTDADLLQRPQLPVLSSKARCMGSGFFRDTRRKGHAASAAVIANLVQFARR